MTLKKLLSLGVTSLCLFALQNLAASTVLAEEASPSTELDFEPAEPEQGAKPANEPQNEPESLLDPSAAPLTEDSPEIQDEPKIMLDVPESLAPSLSPKEVTFDSLKELANWKPDQRADDALNRAAVSLSERSKGHPVNPLASEKAKIQAVSLMNAKSADHSSVGSETFKAYAFDNWQYLDSMVFWDGPVPSPDVIDAAHRNGVPIYGTLFFNWSSSVEDQEKILEFIKEDETGSLSFPYARQIVDIAKYYGFDGYFINQETTGRLLDGKGNQMRDFLLYTKNYAKQKDYPIKIAWYDAMSNSGQRHHVNGVSEANDYFVKPGDKGQVPADDFFVNFNWSSRINDKTVRHMTDNQRDPFDAYAGFELQAKSYNTRIRRKDLTDETGKLKLSLGLYTPDSILGLAKDGEDYHRQETYFWTGPQGNPTKADDTHPIWSGMARYVVDKTPITQANFNTYFNTGHGKKWFIDGKISKDSEWNYRSVSEVLPTWRWWVTANKTALTAGYDFDQAYNGGTSLKFQGQLEADSQNDIMLYASKVPLSDQTKLKLTLKNGQAEKLQVGIATRADYREEGFYYFDLGSHQDWHSQVINLSPLAGQTAYAIKLRIANQKAQENFSLNLGQLALYDSDQNPDRPSNIKVLDKRLFNSQEAEALIQFTPLSDANYYEVYQQIGENWEIITASSNNTIYLPGLRRHRSDQGQKQTLKILALGHNGQRSQPQFFDFDWGMLTTDTTLPRPLAPNIVLGAQIIASSDPKNQGSEGLESMLNGTITSNADKWSSLSVQATVDIRLTQDRQVKRWVMEHAGAGGESVKAGLMNTRDFDLYYKDQEGNWQLAKAIRGNIEHVTDVILDKAITARNWRLHVITAHNGTPWSAIRIYNWKMYEDLDIESNNLPISSGHVQNLPNGQIMVSFDQVKEGVKVSLYQDPQAKHLLTSKTASKTGPLTLDILHQDQFDRLIYYKTLEAGKEDSHLLALKLNKQEKELSSLAISSLPDKVDYKQGQALQLEGGEVLVTYTDGHKEVYRFSHPALSLTGYDPDKLGQQELSLAFLGQELPQKLLVRVAAFDPSQKKVKAISLADKPKTHYRLGQDLDLSKGSLLLRFDDDSSLALSLASKMIQVTGFSQTIGRQTLTVHYGDLTTAFDIILDDKEVVNTQYLEQEISRVEASFKQIAYAYAQKDRQTALRAALKASQELLTRSNLTQELVLKQTQKLKELLAQLDGQDIYDRLEGSLNDETNQVSLRASNKLLGQVRQLVLRPVNSPVSLPDLAGQLYQQYQISLFNQDLEAINPDEVVTLTLPVTKTLKAVYLLKEGKLLPLDFRSQAEKVTIQSEHLGHLLLVFSPDQPDQGKQQNEQTNKLSHGSASQPPQSKEPADKTPKAEKDKPTGTGQKDQDEGKQAPQNSHSQALSPDGSNQSSRPNLLKEDQQPEDLAQKKDQQALAFLSGQEKPRTESDTKPSPGHKPELDRKPLIRAEKDLEPQENLPKTGDQGLFLSLLGLALALLGLGIRKDRP